MKHFHLSTLFLLLLTLVLASGTFAQVVPTDAGQPRGTIPRITNNSNTYETRSDNNPILSRAISFVVSCGLTYLVKEIIWRVVPNEPKQRERIKKEDERNRKAACIEETTKIRLEHRKDGRGS